MKYSSKHSNLHFKMVYPGSQAYHIPARQSPGFPWLHPAYVPRVIIGKVRDEIDRDEKPDDE
ncbi:hypothetical protein [Methanosarcina sp.]|uniref:hypothetical protein n=1 Tax=Methanosarcina sp. TaxID=2213 RepID=UPI003BB53541